MISQSAFLIVFLEIRSNAYISIYYGIFGEALFYSKISMISSAQLHNRGAIVSLQNVVKSLRSYFMGVKSFIVYISES